MFPESLFDLFACKQNWYILIPRFSCIPKKIFFFNQISGVCLKITYSMKNQSLFLTFKHNMFLIKILANASLRINYLREFPSCLKTLRSTYLHLYYRVYVHQSFATKKIFSMPSHHHLTRNVRTILCWKYYLFSCQYLSSM